MRIDVSLGEVEALVRKAARGAGHEWGMAEEAGRAARWLAGQGLDGPGIAVRVLQDAGAAPVAPVAGRRWHAGSQDGLMPEPVLCPLLTGVMLSDRADWLRRSDIDIDGLAQPAMLLPFAGWAARHLDSTVLCRWPDGAARVTGAGLRLDGPVPREVAVLTVSLMPADGLTAGPPTHRATAAVADWQALEALAARTYAPATESSRLRGAGAGTTDTD